MARDVKDRMLAADQYNNEKEYWLNKLSGELQKTCFPSDAPGPGEGIQRQEAKHFQLPGQLYERLVTISNKSDSRLHIILTAGVLLLAYKYTGSNDIIIGTPIDKQDVTGEFLNTILPLRVPIDEQVTVKEFLTAVKNTVLEADENQNYPIEAIPHELDIPVIESEFPLFDIAVLLENIQDKQYLRHININLIFSFLRTGHSIEGIAEYNTAVFKKETIRRIVDHFIHLLQRAFFNVGLKLIDISLLTEEEKKQVVFDFNNTAADYPSSRMIQQLFEEQVEKTPQNIAVEFNGEKLTYKDLNKKANQLARFLRGKGIGEQGAVAAIMLENSLEIPIAVLAVLKAGGTYLPLGFEYPEARIVYMLRDSHAGILLTRESLVQGKNIQCPAVYPDEDDLFTGGDGNLESINQSGNLAYIIYTSGTTGQPKGVMIEHRGLVNYIYWAAQTYVKGERVNFPLYTSISFDLTVTSIFTPLVTGNSIIVYGSPDVRFYIEDVIDDNRVEIVKMTPSHLQFIRDKDMGESIIKRIIVGGDKLDPGPAQDIYNRFHGRVEIYNEYGPTETVVGSMIYKFESAGDNSDSVPIGVPIANTRIYLLDRYLQPIPVGVEGELYIGGDGLARGYLHNPEMTGKKFLPDPFFHGRKMYKTGDTAFRMPDGNIKYKGRIDHQVKIRGFRIELTEIEGKLSHFEGVKESAVVVREDGEDKALYTFFSADRRIEPAAVRNYLAGVLPHYMVPGFIMQLEKIPLTPNGKIDRNALLKIEISGGRDEYIPPETDSQHRLVDIWSEVLGIEKERIGIHTNFFEVGGHSLKVMSLVSKVHKEFDVKVSLVQVFNTPTMGGLASILDKIGVENRYVAIEPQEAKEYYPVSSAQRRFYLAHETNPGNMVYNMTGTIKLQMERDDEKLETIFEKLIRRHDSLRTSFKIINSEPVQFIHPHVDFKLEYHDVKEECLPDTAAKFVRPFNLERPPLCRAAVIRTGQSRTLLVDIHHIIFDGVSLQILTREFGLLSNDGQLEPLPVQYKDYASWQQGLLNDEYYKNMEDYWLDTLENFKVTELPEDHPGNIGGVRGDFESAVIQTDTYLKIENFCAKYKLTLFSFMFSIFSFVISMETGENDVSMGTPVDNREHSDLENIIGVFLNVFLLRAVIDEDDSIINNVLTINGYVVGALGNNTYPYEELYYKVKDHYKLPNDELFTILFNYLPDENASETIPGTISDSLESDRMTALDIRPKYPLTVYISDTGKQMILHLVYRSDLFSKNRLRRIVYNFINFIECAITHGETTISTFVYEDKDKDKEKSNSMEKFEEEFEEEFDDEDLF